MSDKAATSVAILSRLNDAEAVRKLEEAHALLVSHYETVGESDPTDLANQFVTILVKTGATNNERLSSLSFEQIQLAYRAQQPPIFLNKDIAKIFRAGVTGETAMTEPVGRKKAQAMSEKELVAAYSPRLSNPVADRLRELSKGRPFVLIAESGEVLIEPTVKLLTEIMDGHDHRKAYAHDGAVYEPLPVGQGLPRMVDENPLYPGMPLRDDGTCDQTSRSWANVPLEIRQFCRIAWGGKITSISEAHNILDRVLAALTQPEDKRLGVLVTYALKGGAEFYDCKRQGTLPRLKLPLKQANVSGFTIHGKKV